LPIDRPVSFATRDTLAVIALPGTVTTPRYVNAGSRSRLPWKDCVRREVLKAVVLDSNRDETPSFTT